MAGPPDIDGAMPEGMYDAPTVISVPRATHKIRTDTGERDG